jgi:hypothetical protein
MWLPRVILQSDCLGALPPALLPRVLDAAVLPMILESVQRASRLSRLDSLARALGRAPAARDPASLRRACAQRFPQLLKQGMSDLTLAPAMALLLLHDYAARRSSGTATARDR